MSIMWTPIRLTMSSSSQVSSSETQLSSYKLKSSASSFGNELQEVTSCTKETVRITPPPVDAVVLKPTIKTLDGTPNGIPYGNRNNVKASSSHRNANEVTKSDKECQTESEHSTLSSPSTSNSLSNNMKNDNASTSKDSTPSCSTPTSKTPKTPDDSDSIDVIRIEETVKKKISFNSDTLDSFGATIAQEKPVFTSNRDEKPKQDGNLKEDLENDSCCVNCVLTSLQMTDYCCNIS